MLGALGALINLAVGSILYYMIQPSKQTKGWHVWARHSAAFGVFAVTMGNFHKVWYGVDGAAQWVVGMIGIAPLFYLVGFIAHWLFRRAKQAKDSAPGFIEAVAATASGITGQLRESVSPLNLDDSDLYAAVSKEMQEGVIDAGLWAKALVLADGDEKVAKARYIKLRVLQMKLPATSALSNAPSESQPSAITSTTDVYPVLEQVVSTPNSRPTAERAAPSLIVLASGGLVIVVVSGLVGMWLIHLSRESQSRSATATVDTLSSVSVSKVPPQRLENSQLPMGQGSATTIRFDMPKPFTVKLRSVGSGESYMQTTIQLKILPHASDILADYIPEISHRVMLILLKKSAAQISDAKGVQALANELRDEINRTLTGANQTGAVLDAPAPDDLVQAVLFASFIIQ